jgi:hypothetical protein
VKQQRRRPVGRRRKNLRILALDLAELPVETRCLELSILANVARTYNLQSSRNLSQPRHDLRRDGRFFPGRAAPVPLPGVDPAQVGYAHL